jgi:hypothetical protein
MYLIFMRSQVPVLAGHQLSHDISWSDSVLPRNTETHLRLFTLRVKRWCVYKRNILQLYWHKRRNSCTKLRFQEIRHFTSSIWKYFPLMNFTANNQEKFETNSAVHCINIQNTYHLNRPIINLQLFMFSEKYILCQF